MSEKTPKSMVEQLRANRARLLADRTTALKLPGWDSLYVQYKRLPWNDMKPLALAMQETNDDATKEIGNVIDVLLAGCDTFMFKNEDGSLEKLDLRYETGLAELGVIGEDCTLPAEVVLAVFADDEVSMMNHAGEYMAWATRQEDEADAELGKASGRTDA
jgi:hypothetical protein